MKKSETGEVVKSYQYDWNGNRVAFALLKESETIIDATYGYDHLNRISTASERGEVIATYTYDDNGNRASLSYPDQRFPRLSESEIFKVLQSWESDGEERPHEPVEGQLGMEQAIDAGKAGLSYFYEQGIIPAELLSFDKTNAYLCEKQPRGQENYTLNPNYSYWTITFSGENKRATLVINALTGQIWEAAFSGAGIAETEKALEAFTSYLDLGEEGSYITDGTISMKSYSDGMLYAIARSYTATTTKAGEDGLEGFLSMHLSTQAPIIE